MIEEQPEYMEINHPIIRWVDPQVFRVSFADDCMAHECRCRDEGNQARPDACCQHGADVDLYERDAILARAAAIAPVLAEPYRDPARWFDLREPERDPETPSGTLVRTGLADLDDEASGCVFLQHDARGCALHRAALAAGFEPREIKPEVCRLYPLTYGEGLLCLSDDFDRYSCAGAAGPTVYRVMRETLRDVLGIDLVRRLDRAERAVVPRRLPLVARI